MKESTIKHQLQEIFKSNLDFPDPTSEESFGFLGIDM